MSWSSCALCPITCHDVSVSFCLASGAYIGCGRGFTEFWHYASLCLVSIFCTDQLPFEWFSFCPDPQPPRSVSITNTIPLLVDSLRSFAVCWNNWDNSCIPFRYNSSLKNLSTLQLMGSYMEISNYITMVTRVLSRRAKEDTSPSCGQWSRMQDTLISSVCRLAFTGQVWPKAGRVQWP